MTANYERNMILENGKYDVVGTRPIRHDGADKVTGRALYGADFTTTGLLHGKTLRSPHAHARIISIDTSKAAAHPGVKAIVTADDLGPAVKAGTIVDYGEADADLKYIRDNILARDKVLYVGHAIAAVAATSTHEAEEAISLIDVQYEVLSPVLTAPDAMKSDAPLLHNDLVTELGDDLENIDAKDNVAKHLQDKLGDLEKGFSEADVIIEREFNTATVHQGYIEPHNVTAIWNTDNRLTIWTSTQGAFTVRSAVGAALSKPVSEIKVVPMEIGGGFGGKIPIYIDPIEFRIMNSAKEGTRRSDGPIHPKIGCIEVLEAMKNHPHYKAPLNNPNTGRGIAVGYWFNAGLESSAHINVNNDGTINLVEGSTDIGGSRTSLSMQAAEVLGIPVQDVNPSVADTDSVGYTAVTGGSRVTFATGTAVYRAAQDVKQQMTERAALLWDVNHESVEMEKGIVTSTADNGLRMTFKELAAELNDTGGPVIGRGSFDGKGEGGSYAGNIVDIAVDPDTGKIEILRFTVFQDAGKAIHPSYVEGQMQGGSAQGIGWALNEEYFMNSEGTMTNSTLLDYRMPISLDLPLIDTVIIEVPNPTHPLGVRGVGEANIAPPPAALADAIYNATGSRMSDLPMNPTAVMESIWKQ